MPDRARTLAVIGGGLTGLCTGCYAQMNGYQTHIFEMSGGPGGLCTSWQRNGYTIDLSVHWLVGSAPRSSYYRLWEEVGLIQGRTILDLDEFFRLEGRDGREVIFATDLDRLEENLLAVSPRDASVIHDLIADARKLSGHDMPADVPPRGVLGPLGAAKAIAQMAPFLRPLQKWRKVTAGEFAGRFVDPLLRETFVEMWSPDMAMFFILMTMAWMHDKVAGYAIGGSLPMAQAIEQRFLDLGGEIEYGARVTEIMAEAGRAVGVKLADGAPVRAEAVISAADGHATIFEMLGGRYLDDQIRGYYRDFPLFPPLVFMGLGVARSFEDLPRTISGFSLPLERPLRVGATEIGRLPVRIHNIDPTLAPPGKTAITLPLMTDYPSWRDLAAGERAAYEAEKQALADAVIAALDERFPGLAGDVEMVDVATPATFERYTGNWQASFEGWFPTPDTMLVEMPRTLPGLEAFFMAGQWVAPGGGLPTAVSTARQAVQLLCHQDGVAFETSVP